MSLKQKTRAMSFFPQVLLYIYLKKKKLFLTGGLILTQFDLLHLSLSGL